MILHHIMKSQKLTQATQNMIPQCSSEDHILCNDEQTVAVEKPCSEKSLAQMEQELTS